MTTFLQELRGMTNQIVRMRTKLNRIKTVLLYQKDKDKVDSIKKHLTKAKLNVTALRGIFKYRDDAILKRSY